MLLAAESSVHFPQIQLLNGRNQPIDDDDDGAMATTQTLSLTEVQPGVSSVSRMPAAS